LLPPLLVDCLFIVVVRLTDTTFLEVPMIAKLLSGDTYTSNLKLLTKEQVVGALLIAYFVSRKTVFYQDLPTQ
jgi:hypothetical protein